MSRTSLVFGWGGPPILAVVGALCWWLLFAKQPPAAMNLACVGQAPRAVKVGETFSCEGANGVVWCGGPCGYVDIVAPTQRRKGALQAQPLERWHDYRRKQ